MKTFSASRILALAAPLVLAWMVGSAPLQAQAITTTTSVRIPLPQPFQRFVPCAAGGAGELVDLTGTLHLLVHTTLDASGGFRSSVQSNPEGVTGIGLTTGDIYRGTGVTRRQINDEGTVGEERTVIGNFRLIGPGPDNNFLLHQNLNVTVNANGVVTAYVSNISVECR